MCLLSEDSGNHGLMVTQAKKFVRPHLNSKIAVCRACCYHPSDSRKHKWENRSPGQLGHIAKPYLQTNQRQKGWRHGSSSRVHASQVRSPEFRPQYYQKICMYICIWIKASFQFYNELSNWNLVIHNKENSFNNDKILKILKPLTNILSTPSRANIWNFLQFMQIFVVNIFTKARLIK
jgi:hypothetical protein